MNLLAIGLGLMDNPGAIRNGLLTNPVIPAMSIGSKHIQMVDFGTTIISMIADHAFIVRLLLKATLTNLASV